MPQRGSLVIAGSGIASVAHMTLETVSYIKEADKIHYVVNDPITEGFIQKNSKGNYADLSVFYEKEKSRYITYIQMAEAMLQDVRAGRSVLGIFYGHPGFFVFPSHRAIAIAREEGYEAKMLPGVSSEDYLYADLGIDPFIAGCMSHEANTLLIKNQPLDPTVHHVILQVGIVCVENMNFNNKQFHLLVDVLENSFGPGHKVVHYIGSVIPQMKTTKDELVIAELRKDEVMKRIQPGSTLYVPPAKPVPVDRQLLKKLGLTDSAIEHWHQEEIYPRQSWLNKDFPAAPAYRQCDKDAVAQMASRTVPSPRSIFQTSPTMLQLLIDLSLQPKLCKQYQEDPSAMANATDGLSANEKLALSSGKYRPILEAMQSADGKFTGLQVAGSAEEEMYYILGVV